MRSNQLPESGLELSLSSMTESKLSLINNLTITNCSAKLNILSEEFEYLICIIYGIIFVVTFIGSFGTTVVTASSERLRRVPANIFMLHLCLANLLFIVVSIPSYLYRTLYEDAYSSNIVICKISNSINYLTVTASFTMIVIVAIERRRALLRYHHVDHEFFKVHLIALAAWVWSLCIAAPYLAFYEVKEIPYIGLEFRNGSNGFCMRNERSCGIYRISDQSFSILTTVVILLQYYIPVCIVVPCYLQIGFILKTRGLQTFRQQGSRQTDAGQSETIRNRRKKQTFLLLALIVVIFVVGWGPLFIVELVSATLLVGSHLKTPISFLICHMCGAMSVCLCPYTYLLSETFRAELTRMVQRWSRCKHHQVAKSHLDSRSNTCRVIGPQLDCNQAMQEETSV